MIRVDTDAVSCRAARPYARFISKSTAEPGSRQLRVGTRNSAVKMSQRFVAFFLRLSGKSFARTLFGSLFALYNALDKERMWNGFNRS